MLRSSCEGKLSKTVSIVGFPIHASHSHHKTFIAFLGSFSYSSTTETSTQSKERAFDKRLKAFSFNQKKSQLVAKSIRRKKSHSSFSSAGKFILGPKLSIPIVGVKFEFSVLFSDDAPTRSKAGGNPRLVSGTLARLEGDRIGNRYLGACREGISGFTCFLGVGVRRLDGITGTSRVEMLFPPNVGVGNTPRTSGIKHFTKTK